MATSYRFLIVAFAIRADAAPSWPIPYSYSPDSMPIIQVRLAPPSNPMPEVTASLGALEAERAQFETERMLEVESAYSASLGRASEELPALIDRLMRTFETPTTLLSKRQHEQDEVGRQATQFQELRVVDGHEMTARINVLPVLQPDAALEANIRELEEKRTTHEGKIFDQAMSEMNGLTTIVLNEVEAQITRHASGFRHALKFGVGESFTSARSSPRATGFRSVEEHGRASAPQLTTNVRVMASEEPFPRVASMVEGSEKKRDASEDSIRTRLLELEVKLLQAENSIVSAKLGAWADALSQKSK